MTHTHTHVKQSLKNCSYRIIKHKLVQNSFESVKSAADKETTTCTL